MVIYSWVYRYSLSTSYMSLRPSYVVWLYVSFSGFLSFFGYLNGDRTPYLLYVIIYFIIFIVSYAAVYFIKSLEDKVEIKSISLMLFVILYSFFMRPVLSLISSFLFVHIAFFTVKPKSKTDIDKSISNFFFSNLPKQNIFILIAYLFLSVMFLYFEKIKFLWI